MKRQLRELVTEVLQSFRASPVFVIVLLLALGSAGSIGLLFVLMNVAPESLPPPFSQMGHGIEPAHRVHDITFGLLFGVAVVGMLAQLRRPSKNAAGLLMALTPWIALVLAGGLSGAFGHVVLRNPARIVAPLALIAALLHPSGRDLFRSFSRRRLDRVMLALLVAAAGPLLAYAATNLRLQASVTDSHAAMGHYGFMAAFSFTIIGLGLTASLRPAGWKLTAFVASLLPVLLGVLSILYPDASSSLGPVWAIAAIGWGIGFSAAAKRAGNAELALSVVDTAAGTGGGSTGRVRPWQVALGLLALAVALTSVTPFAVGVGAGHGPGMHELHAGARAPIDGARELAITADELAFDPDRVELRTGELVNVVLASNDLRHDLVIEDVDFYLAAGANETAAGALMFHQPGTYVGYCSVPGHREGGMEIELVVTGDGHDPSAWQH